MLIRRTRGTRHTEDGLRCKRCGKKLPKSVEGPFWYCDEHVYQDWVDTA